MCSQSVRVGTFLDEASALHVAAANDQLAIVKHLVTSGAAIDGVTDARDARGDTPLILACQRDNLAVATELLNARANPNARNLFGGAPMRESNPLLQLLLIRSVPRWHTGTALYYACQHGYAGCAAACIAAGGQVDLSDHKGTSPLGIACYNNNAECASLCIAHSVEPEAARSVNFASHDGITPLLYACWGGSLATIKLLCFHGAWRRPANARARCSRISSTTTWNCEKMLADRGHAVAHLWMRMTRDWTTPLHYFADGLLGTGAVIDLLRAGAQLEAGMPTLRYLAEQLCNDKEHDVGKAAQLVLLADQPWSPCSHVVWPEAARAQATTLLMLGYLIAASFSEGLCAPALVDVWRGPGGVIERLMRRADYEKQVIETKGIPLQNLRGFRSRADQLHTLLCTTAFL